MHRTAFAALVSLGLIAGLSADDTKAAKTRADLEKKFIDTMTNAVLEGSFTIDGRNSDKPPPKDKYEIQSVQKSGGDVWVITAKMSYFNRDFTLPCPVEVRWAGDTPMIMLTKVGLPGMNGKFSTRLLIDGDRYAGTWSHDEVGGHMWGKISKKPAEPKSGDSK
jgi:hypothetical protein